MHTTALTPRDRAVLRAVAAGRCTLATGSALLVDGRFCADQFAGLRLSGAGLIAGATGAAALTPAGRALLGSS